MLIFIGLASWVACAFFCSNVARAKGYSSSSWFFAGFFFGFFALIAVAGLPDKKLRKYLLQIGVKQEAIKRATLPWQCDLIEEIVREVKRNPNRFKDI